MPFTIVRQDITQMRVDAIVNAANTELLMGGGVCGAIFRAAGAERMQAACRGLAPIQTGEAVITPGFALPAKYVIHAAGPVYDPYNKESCEQALSSAYAQSLMLAVNNGCESIAFPLISSGIYGYPKAEALRVASETIRDFLNYCELDVYLAVFDKEAFAASRGLVGEIANYLSEHWTGAPECRRMLSVEREAIERAEKHIPPPCDGSAAAPPPKSKPKKKKGWFSRLTKRSEPDNEDRTDFSESEDQYTCALTDNEPLVYQYPTCEPIAAGSLEDMLRGMDVSFSEALLRLIDAKGKTDVEVYKKANIDRKLFSKIRKGNGYTPKKTTILALAVALELSLTETDELLAHAGYKLSNSSKLDVIVQYFIINQRYNIYDINLVLFQYDQPTLGS